MEIRWIIAISNQLFTKIRNS